MQDWFGAGTKPLEWILAINTQVWPPFPTQSDAVSKAVGRPLWREMSQDSAGEMEGEVSSTQTLRIESVGRVVSQRKTKVLFTRIKERQMLNGKKPKTTTLCFK